MLLFSSNFRVDKDIGHELTTESSLGTSHQIVSCSFIILFLELHTTTFVRDTPSLIVDQLHTG
jgi:hypothetical protein